MLRTLLIVQSYLERTLRRLVSSRPSSKQIGGLRAPPYLLESGDAAPVGQGLDVLTRLGQASKRAAAPHGALVYGNKRFIQLLEGEQAVLEQAYAYHPRCAASTPVQGRRLPHRGPPFRRMAAGFSNSLARPVCPLS